MTFVKVKIALSKMRPGDMLEIRLAAGEALRNIPRNTVQMGYEVTEPEPVGDSVYRIVITVPPQR